MSGFIGVKRAGEMPSSQVVKKSLRRASRSGGSLSKE